MSINLTWILTVLGVIVGGAAMPIGLVLLWERMSLIATVASPWISLCFGLTAWFVVTKQRSREISVATTGDPLNAVAGNIASLMTGLLCSIVLSLIFPAKYTSTDPTALARAEKINGKPRLQVVEDDSEKVAEALPRLHGQGTPGIEAPSSNLHVQDTAAEKGGEHAVANISSKNGLVDFLETSFSEPIDEAAVRTATRVAVGFNAAFLVVAVILVPFTLFGSSWIFSRAGFRGWCVVSFIWVWVGMIICVLWPLFESRSTIFKIARGVSRDLGGGKRDENAQSSV